MVADAAKSMTIAGPYSHPTSGHVGCIVDPTRGQWREMVGVGGQRDGGYQRRYEEGGGDVQRFELLQVLVEHRKAEEVQRHPHREEQLHPLRVHHEPSKGDAQPAVEAA